MKTLNGIALEPEVVNGKGRHTGADLEYNEQEYNDLMVKAVYLDKLQAVTKIALDNARRKGLKGMESAFYVETWISGYFGAKGVPTLEDR